MLPRILLVDPDAAWCKRFRETVAGLLCEVHTAASPADARLALKRSRFQLVLVANRLGRLPGLPFVDELQAHPDHPAVLYISTLADTDRRVLALHRGADDVIEREMRADELRLRIARKLARLQAFVTEWHLGRAVLHALRPGLTVDGTHIRLTYAQHRMLVVLVQAAGAPVPRELLLRAIRPTSDELGSNATLDSHICRLRAKVAIAGLVIETIKTIGYALRVTASTAAVA